MNPHLSQKMSTYRKTHSCGTPLIKLKEDWKMAANNKEHVTVLSTDMSKTFDSLHPQREGEIEHWSKEELGEQWEQWEFVGEDVEEDQ